MLITRLVATLFWLSFLCSGIESDEENTFSSQTHMHDEGKDLQKKMSSFLHDLEENYCQKTAATNDTREYKTSSNFTSTFCSKILDLLSSEHKTEHEHEHQNVTEKTTSASTWGYAILACTIISLVGLVAVAIIPLMHRVVYNHLLQFLVSLAIGSLLGDALLHLIPHAISGHHHHHEHSLAEDHHHHDPHSNDHHHDKRPVWLGLATLGGLFMLFVVERIVGYCSERRRKRNKGQKYVTSDVNATNGMMVVDGGGDRKEGSSRVVPLSNGSASCEEMLMVVHASKDIKKMAYEAQEEMHKNCETPSVGQANMVHSRGAHHHHSHEVPGSVAAVAWMVIVGDGFHNFADGIAIGSAFASSIQDGISTSIAIFCHELPHELGDFAMLLSAGMSGKQALVYNCVSSILCILGMCVGVGVGNLVSATPWIFMVIAGMFIYIALVDMLPEMKSVDPKRGEHPLLHLGLQVVGMWTGTIVMLLIAFFEDRISIQL